MRKGGRATRRLVEEMSLPRSGSVLPSLNDGQDNCGYRLGQQPQSVPKITLDGPGMDVNIRRDHRSLTPPMSTAQIVDKRTEIRDLLAAHLAGSLPEKAIHGALREFTRCERDRGEHAERVVIALKAIWDSLRDERQSLSREKQIRLLDRLVTRCIDEYYETPGGA